jgi:Histidine kinase-, DNA gyrase B-, and HSP90-like ATPase
MPDSEGDVSIMSEDEEFLQEWPEDDASDDDAFLSENENDRRGVKGKASGKQVPKKKPAVTKGKSKAAALADKSNTIDIEDDEDEANDYGRGKPKIAATGKKKTIEEMYQSKNFVAYLLLSLLLSAIDQPFSQGRCHSFGRAEKTQVEHILLRPDTYIGSVGSVTESMYVLDSANELLVEREITYTPGLYKIFDEIVVNAADNKQRDPNMSELHIVINAEENFISVMNNGKGIPVQMHKEHKCYVPTMIFSHLLSGSNFDDSVNRTTGFVR